MIPFLKSIAKAYASRYTDLSEYCFLFPNKRSGTFFMKYLREECGERHTVAPEIKTISDFTSDVAHVVVASRLDLIFMLYGCYRRLTGHSAETSADDELAFDSFRTWGETVISDFNEVDMYLADPDEVFRNVKDFREISSNFLTEEQKKVMQEYFGHTESETYDSSRFWKSYRPVDEDGNLVDEESLSEVKKRFIHLWRILSPLYHAFSEALSKAGMSTPGGCVRKAVEVLRERGKDALPYKKVVAVGFNALTTSENALFSLLRDFEDGDEDEPFADFFWDATGPVLSAGSENSASKFVRSNIRQFPAPEWARTYLSQSDNQRMPRIRVAASPSRAAQTKIAGDLLSEMKGHMSEEEIKDARVAVVLPDENLLLPMLYSLPSEMKEANLTMGYSFRLTSVAPFVTLLRRLQKNARSSKEGPTFYHRNLRLFLSHPYSTVMFGSSVIEKVIQELDLHHKSVMTLEEVRTISPAMAETLDPASVGHSPQEVLQYIDMVLGRAATAISEGMGAMMKTHLEIDHIKRYRDSLRRLGDVIEEYGINMRPDTVMQIADYILSAEKIGFEGEPLSGLQVMGTLETRSIDFDYLVVLSMNEKIMPRRARRRSFIPDTLRHAYGMPPSNYAEEIFAYYFFRMISRAKEVALIYDARTGGDSGDVSRYIRQLRHLYAPGQLEETEWKFDFSGDKKRALKAKKTKEIRKRLEAYQRPGGRNFSASTLSSYRECQLRFFFQHILRISTEEAHSDYLDAITVGQILHGIMSRVYLPAEEMCGKYLRNPIVVTKERIESIIGDTASLWRLTRQIVNKEHFHLPEEKLDTELKGVARIVASKIMGQAINVMRRDLTLAPFRLYGCEIEDLVRVELKSGKTVNFKFAIDRLDEIMVGGEPRLRIVDYKTGSLKLNASEFNEVLDGDYRQEQIFQLFTYAWLLKKLGISRDDDVMTEIYDVPKISKGDVNLPRIGPDKKDVVNSYAEYASRFEEGIDAMLEGIFTKECFEPAADYGKCRMCAFRQLCGR